MRDDGKAIIIITHKLNEVESLSDKVAVLRTGRYIGTLVTKAVWDADKRSVTLTLSFDKDLIGREVALLVCLSDGVKEVTVKASKKPLKITL